MSTPRFTCNGTMQPASGGKWCKYTDLQLAIDGTPRRDFEREIYKSEEAYMTAEPNAASQKQSATLQGNSPGESLTGIAAPYADLCERETDPFTLAERWQEVHSDESYGAQGKNLGILARAFLTSRSRVQELEASRRDQCQEAADALRELEAGREFQSKRIDQIVIEEAAATKAAKERAKEAERRVEELEKQLEECKQELIEMSYRENG